VRFSTQRPNHIDNVLIKRLASGRNRIHSSRKRVTFVLKDRLHMAPRAYSGRGFEGQPPSFGNFFRRFFKKKNPKISLNFPIHTKKIKTPLKKFLDTPLYGNTPDSHSSFAKTFYIVLDNFLLMILFCFTKTTSLPCLRVIHI